jgi:hypothetical protein
MGKYHCTVDLLFDWFGMSCMTTDNFCDHLQNSLIQTSQTGGQWYSDTSPFSIPWFVLLQKLNGKKEIFKNPFNVHLNFLVESGLIFKNFLKTILRPFKGWAALN